MASITIRSLDTMTNERLGVQAAQHGRSMEAEARLIPQSALQVSPDASKMNLYDRVRARIEPLGGVELEIPPRTGTRAPLIFE